MFHKSATSCKSLHYLAEDIALQVDAALRILQSLLDVFPRASNTTATTDSNTKDNNSALICRRYLTQYTTRLIAESQPTMAVESLLDYSLDTELNGVLAELNRLSAVLPLLVLQQQQQLPKA
jgi:hypothetical protein